MEYRRLVDWFKENPRKNWSTDESGFYRFNCFPGGIRLSIASLSNFINSADYMDESVSVVLVNYVRAYLRQYYQKSAGFYFYTVVNDDFENPQFASSDPQSGMLNEQILSQQVETNQILFLFRSKQQNHLFWMNKQLADYAKIEYGE